MGVLINAEVVNGAVNGSRRCFYYIDSIWHQSPDSSSGKVMRTTTTIRYHRYRWKIKKTYKYELAEDFVIDTRIKPVKSATHDYVELERNGILKISKEYRWDGPSGLTLDTPNFMRASLIHDALYELMKYGYLELHHKSDVDRLFRETCINDGMSALRAWTHYTTVRMLGKGVLKPVVKEPVQLAP
jgi:hypothetical protein